MRPAPTPIAMVWANVGRMHARRRHPQADLLDHTSIGGWSASFSRTVRFHLPSVAAASYVLWQNSRTASRGEAAPRTSSYLSRNCESSALYDAAGGRTDACGYPDGSGAA